MSYDSDWLEKMFKRHEDEFGKFERVKKPLNGRADHCAFMLLDRLAPGRADIVSCAEHDRIWLCIPPSEIAGEATEEDIITLIRCGIMLDEDSFSMFV